MPGTINGGPIGGGSASLPDDPAAVLLGAPSTFVALDAAGVGEALAPAAARVLLADTETYTFASATGVTLVNGTVGGSAAVTGGVLRLTCPATPAAGYYGSTLEAPYGQVAVQLDDGGFKPLRWRAIVRAAAIGSGSILRFLAVSSSGFARVGFFAGPDGSIGAENNVAVSNYATAGAGSFAVNGTGWLAIEIDGDVAAYYYGAGTTSAPPSSWTTLAVAVLPSTTEWTTLRLIGSTNSLPGSPTSVDFDDLTVEVL